MIFKKYTVENINNNLNKQERESVDMNTERLKLSIPRKNEKEQRA